MTRLASLLLCLAAVPAAAEWQPDTENELQVESAAVLEDFRALDEERASRYLEDSYGYAVFPRLKRGALLFGWASGKGVVIERGELTGWARQRRFSLGAQIGWQAQSQIIFFRDEATMTAWKEGVLEFAPQASTAAGRSGSAADGAFNPRVAVFSFSPKGLIAEAAAGATKYSYKPIGP